MGRGSRQRQRQRRRPAASQQLYDTPGVGTEQCPIEEIMASIRTKFEKNIKFQCILTTAPATTTTPGAGGRIVKLLLNEGLCGDEVEAWNHVILVGTKADRADKFDKKRFQDTIVKELFEAAPLEPDQRKFCFTQAKARDPNGNATELDVTQLVDKIAELPNLEDFFFKRWRLDEDLLNKICTKILGCSAERAKEMKQELHDALEREKALFKHAPGLQKTKQEKDRFLLYLAHVADHSLPDPKGKILKDLTARREFIDQRLIKKVIGNTRMTRTQLIDELVRLKLLAPCPPNGKYARGTGVKFAAPPEGTKADITWRLYIHQFKEDVEQKYVQLLNQPSAQAPPPPPAPPKPAKKRPLSAPVTIHETTPATARSNSVECRVCGGRKPYKSKKCDEPCRSVLPIKPGLCPQRQRTDGSASSSTLARASAPLPAPPLPTTVPKQCTSCGETKMIPVNNALCKACGKQKKR